MEFKEFTEYSNPEKVDYDIKSGFKRESETTNKSQYINKNKYSDIFNELYFNLGCPEDFELEAFGITIKEFDNPTKETIEKLKKYAQYYQSQTVNNYKERGK